MPDELFVDVPFDRKMERRLELRWDAADRSPPTPAEQRIADRIEFVFLTWDPFGWTEDVELDRVLSIEPGPDGRIAMLFAGSAVQRFTDPYPGREFAAYAEWVVRTVTRQFAAFDAADWEEFFEEVAIEARSIPSEWRPAWSPPTLITDSGWQPMTVEAVTEYVAAMTGFEPFDPPTIRLEPVDASAVAPVETCPACRGLRLRLPFEFDDARADMCSPHRAAANAHMARIVVPKRDDDEWAWSMFTEVVGRRLGEPHLPVPLRGELDRVLYDEPSTIGRAEALLELVDLAADRACLEQLLDDAGWEERDGEDPLWTFDTESGRVAFQLGREGEFDAAGRFIDRLAAFDPDRAYGLHAELAAQAARAGLPTVARERIAEADAAPAVESWPNLLVADAEAALGDTEAAAERLRSARDAARDVGETAIEREALAQLRDVLRDVDDPARAEELAAAELDLAALTEVLYPTSDEPGPPVREVPPNEFGRKVGRNEPCPCGSGQKYKKCHGR